MCFCNAFVLFSVTTVSFHFISSCLILSHLLSFCLLFPLTLSLSLLFYLPSLITCYRRLTPGTSASARTGHTTSPSSLWVSTWTTIRLLWTSSPSRDHGSLRTHDQEMEALDDNILRLYCDRDDGVNDVCGSLPQRTRPSQCGFLFVFCGFIEGVGMCDSLFYYK